MSNWNQGNGNGYGQQGQAYGYGPDDVYEEMNRARDPGGARFPYIEAGRHKLALVTLENFMHRTDGKSTRALFQVVESSTDPQTGKPVHAPGTYVVKIYKLMERPKYEGTPSNREQLAHLCMALKNAPKGYPIGRDIKVLLEDRPAEQLARGTIVECTGVPNKKGNWVNLYWNAIPQTEQDIVAMRQRIEQQGVPQTNGNSGQPPMQQPAAQQYAGPQGQQYAPPGGQQPQQGYQMPQTQYGLPPGAQPQQQWQGQQPMGQQYAQPPAQQPAAQPQGAPQGGFLAQLPPQGGQGGNGGRGW